MHVDTLCHSQQGSIVDVMIDMHAVVTHHPAETSAVILIGLGLSLSPYLLLGGAVFLLLFGVPNIPASMKPLVPAPVLEASLLNFWCFTPETCTVSFLGPCAVCCIL